MATIFNAYLRVFARRNFSILILTLLLGQIASGLLLLALVNSVFTKTGSNFSVAGIVLSLALPGFLFVAFSGLAADLIDRKKLILISNFAISVVVLLIIFSLQSVFSSILLSFLYFAANTFFIPAASAVSGQLVRKDQLTIANSLFILTLSGGQLIGFFVGAIFNFFFETRTVLIFCELLLIICVFLPLLLPSLPPRKDNVTLNGKIIDIFKGFIYVFQAKQVWFFFVAFAAIQGWAAFGSTLAPGFFDEVWGIRIDKSPILVMPFLGLGNILGALVVHQPKVSETRFIALGMAIVGISGLFLGIILKYGLISGLSLYVPLAIFLTGTGFGAIIHMIAARAALQRRVAHRYQGTVFGAYVIFSTLLACVMSPTAAVIELFWGYVNVLILGGVIFVVCALAVHYVGTRWKF